jgi:predicted lipase
MVTRLRKQQLRVDIAEVWWFLMEQMEVYTFGCPRVGNAAFAAEVNMRVPELWHVINDKDTVGC